MKERDNMEDFVLWNGRFMLKIILKKEYGAAGLGSSSSI